MRRFLFVFGKVLTAVLGCISMAFVISLIQLQMLPSWLIVMMSGMLTGMVGLTFWLTYSGSRKIRMSLGTILAAITIILLSIGTFYVQKTVNMLDKVFHAQTETVHVGIYIRMEDRNDYNDVATEYVHGILEELDRENTDEILMQMEEQLQTKLVCKEYQHVTQLVDALLNQQVDAIILNQAYLDVLKDLDIYQDIMDRIHEVSLKKVEVEIVPPTETTLPSTEPTVEEEEPQGIEPFAVYISGIDSHGPVNLRSCSDVNILMVANPQTRQILLVSTPRDYYIPLTVTHGIPDKLTHGGIYGVQVSKDTLGKLYGVNIDHYFRINFTGFLQVIDVLGGVTVYSEHEFYAHTTPRYHFIKGDNEMNAKMALAFCRERKAFPLGDRQRGKNQMALIKGVINKMTSAAMLKNYADVLEVVENSVDTNVPLELVRDLVSDQLQNGGTWNVVTYSVDGTGDTQIPYSLSIPVYVMQPDYETVERAKDLIQQVYDGKIIGTTS